MRARLKSAQRQNRTWYAQRDLQTEYSRGIPLIAKDAMSGAHPRTFLQVESAHWVIAR